MYASPHSLQDTSLQTVCENIVLAYEKGRNDPTFKNLLKCPETYFPNCIAELILENLSKVTVISDRILSLFDEKITGLQRVKIPNASKLTTKGLCILRKHKISHLHVQNLVKITVNDLIGCLGEWTLHNLRSLNVSHCEFMNREKICVIVALSKLKNIHSLNVSHTDFSFQSLEIMTQDLPLLDTLDISETSIRNLLPLKKCKSRLKRLTMFDLKIPCTDEFVTLVASFENLVYLDMSDDCDDRFAVNLKTALDVSKLLNVSKGLPNLAFLDVSGKSGFTKENLKSFMKSHPNLKFLGLMFANVCQEDMFCKESDPDFNKELVVAGGGTLKQIKEALERYLPRRFYVQKSLFNLYNNIQRLDDVAVDFILLTLQAMKRHPTVMGIQLASTACIYHLTKGNFSLQIHPHLLRKIVHMLLISMETYPGNMQLQKNSLLTLCSDHILQNVEFDKFRCSVLVMESLVSFADSSMNRMSVAICSILAAKISTEQTTKLGTTESYMERLLGIVKNKTTHQEFDIMMKFTLSALWNLTDESPPTCTVFLNLGGMDLFIWVLNVFAGESAVETKVLGLLNNIAEVPRLRSHLMKEEFLITLRTLLHSTSVDVSYFSAGIFAHLASDDNDLWKNTPFTRPDMLKELAQCVLKWDPPETEMVAYRSFSPFFSLLKCNEHWEVQLWAVWAIHHVTSKNPRRYCPMLINNDGVSLISSLLECTSIDANVIELSDKIIKIVNPPVTYSQASSIETNMEKLLL